MVSHCAWFSTRVRSAKPTRVHKVATVYGGKATGVSLVLLGVLVSLALVSGGSRPPRAVDPWFWWLWGYQAPTTLVTGW